MDKIIIFDIETQHLFHEVDHIHKNLKVSVVGTYDYSGNEYRAYLEDELPELFRKFEHADLIVGYNSLKFDLPVLAPYYLGNIYQFRHLDLLSEIEKVLGFRVSLNDLAHSTLGKKKSGHGLMAVEYFRNKEWDKLKQYCLDDVKITREIYEFGKNKGRLFYNNGRGNQELKVDFNNPAGNKPTVSLSLPF